MTGETPIYDSLNNGEIPKPEPILGPVTGENEVAHSNRPQPKVVAATVGAGVGAAISTIAVWVIEMSTRIDVPTQVEGASVVIFTAAVAFVSGYYKKN